MKAALPFLSIDCWQRSFPPSESDMYLSNQERTVCLVTLKAGEREQLSAFGIGKLAEQCKSVDQSALLAWPRTLGRLECHTIL